jgi:hypothetical protein
MANVKHYNANNQESDRHGIDEIIDERGLREIYMPGFKAAVEEGDVASVICAYPKVNGTFNCENNPLLTGVLDGEWKFRGFVLSDWGATPPNVSSAKHFPAFHSLLFCGSSSKDVPPYLSGRPTKVGKWTIAPPIQDAHKCLAHSHRCRACG